MKKETAKRGLKSRNRIERVREAGFAGVLWICASRYYSFFLALALNRSLVVVVVVVVVLLFFLVESHESESYTQIELTVLLDYPRSLSCFIMKPQGRMLAACCSLSLTSCCCFNSSCAAAP